MRVPWLAFPSNAFAPRGCYMYAVCTPCRIALDGRYASCSCVGQDPCRFRREGETETGSFHAENACCEHLHSRTGNGRANASRCSGVVTEFFLEYSTVFILHASKIDPKMHFFVVSSPVVSVFSASRTADSHASTGTTCLMRGRSCSRSYDGTLIGILRE